VIPLPYAADDHQRKNAEAFEKAGAGKMVLQSALTPERLAEEILALARVIRNACAAWPQRAEAWRIAMPRQRSLNWLAGSASRACVQEVSTHSLC
jgi:UDP-N-acetylglucosamine:LPS N-acetylglucosamine transferase